MTDHTDSISPFKALGVVLGVVLVFGIFFAAAVML